MAVDTFVCGGPLMHPISQNLLQYGGIFTPYGPQIVNTQYTVIYDKSLGRNTNNMVQCVAFL